MGNNDPQLPAKNTATQVVTRVSILECLLHSLHVRISYNHYSVCVYGNKHENDECGNDTCHI